MILDEQAIFSDNQAVTADAASTNNIKFKGEVAFGTPIEVLVQVTEAFKTAEVASLTVKVQTDDNAAFSSPSDLATETINLAVGSRNKIKFLPRGNEGYIRLYYDLTFQTGVSAATAGKIVAGVVDGTPESYHNA